MKRLLTHWRLFSLVVFLLLAPAQAMGAGTPSGDLPSLCEGSLDEETLWRYRALVHLLLMSEPLGTSASELYAPHSPEEALRECFSSF